MAELAKTELTLTFLQQELFWEDEANNLQLFDTLIGELKTETDIIILPEVFGSGFSMNARKLSVSMDGAALGQMKKWAYQKQAAICGSLMIEENGKYYNRFLWVEPNGTVLSYDKAHLFRMGEENQQFEKGKERLLISYKGWQIAPLVCYDLRFPVWIRRTPDYDYDLLLIVANWPEKRAAHWKALGIARAIENQAFVAAVNRVGKDGLGVYHSGDSQLINPLGEVKWTASGIACVETLTINKEELQQYRSIFPVQLDADSFSME